MKQSGEIEVKGGRLIYQMNRDHVEIESCRVMETVLEIPDRIEDFWVTKIAKKAVLSNKALRELVLPQNIAEVGDWAFAHCTNLQKVWMPQKNIRFGKGVFKECKNLLRIYWKGQEDEKMAGLLSMVPVMLDAEYLLTPMEAGEKEWLEKLDARLVTLLQRADEDGYLKQVLCGEEDLMASLEIYLANRRREKSSLCFARLCNHIGLKDDLKQYLQKYLRENTKGCEYEAAWEVVLKEHPQDIEYYRILADAGGITTENFQKLIEDMGESYPEMKGWLLRYKEENMAGEDFFAGLSL